MQKVTALDLKIKSLVESTGDIYKRMDGIAVVVWPGGSKNGGLKC
ncbi:hypothetical protein [Candidatus Ichthyocystis sparus]|nr:hypothetical protein [Candidatus Ichthyocystis sparus]